MSRREVRDIDYPECVPMNPQNRARPPRKRKKAVPAAVKCICHEGFGMNLSCPQHGLNVPPLEGREGSRIRPCLRCGQNPGRHEGLCFYCHTVQVKDEDTALLNWLDKNNAEVHRSGPSNLIRISWWNGKAISWTRQFKNLREAIQAAKKEQETDLDAQRVDYLVEQWRDDEV